MFSKACTYAIRAMIYICYKSNQNERVGIKDIAKEINSPEAFTGKILQQLSKKGIIESAKGPHGGFYLNEDQKKISLFSIVETIDGDQLMKGCGLGFKECSDDYPCPLHDHFKDIRKQFNQMLKDTSLSELNQSFEDGLSFFQQ